MTQRDTMTDALSSVLSAIMAGELYSEFITPAEFKRGMRQIATPTAIATSSWNGEPAGLTVSSFCSLNSAPPRMLVCINRSAGAFPLLAEGRNLGLNVLATHHQALAMQFASSDNRPQRFEMGDWGTIMTGAPILLDSVVAFDCRVVSIHEMDTHGIVIADVVGMLCASSDVPLLYRDGKFVTIAPGGV